MELKQMYCCTRGESGGDGGENLTGRGGHNHPPTISRATRGDSGDMKE